MTSQCSFLLLMSVFFLVLKDHDPWFLVDKEINCFVWRVYVLTWECVCVCVSATNPDMKKRAKVQHNFKVTSDGRLIIKEDNDEGDKTKGSRTHTDTQTHSLLWEEREK